jgi:SM-20-related protein
MVLNPALDADALCAAYQRARRLQIQDVLLPDVAERTFMCLTEETPWGLCYNEGQTPVELTPEKLRGLPAEEAARISAGAIERAGQGIQYLYRYYPIVTNAREGRDKGLYLHDVLKALNTEEVLSFARRVTGIPSLIKASGQATYYAPGHFLTRHDDGMSHRKVAYVLGFTKGWRSDWGGLLQFSNEENTAVTDVFLPRFNALSLFTVPQHHAVTFVAPFASTGRFSITGWFHDS